MKNWKKNAVVASILVFVCAGIYLNWSYSQSQETINLTDTLNQEKILGSSTLVMSQNNPAVDAAQEDLTASAELEDIVQTALCESQIESLIIAKGYADCVAYMNESGISVAVAAPEEGLQETDVALITDIVMTQSDYGFEDIRIVPVK